MADKAKKTKATASAGAAGLSEADLPLLNEYLKMQADTQQLRVKLAKKGFAALLDPTSVMSKPRKPAGVRKPKAAEAKAAEAKPKKARKPRKPKAPAEPQPQEEKGEATPAATSDGGAEAHKEPSSSE